MDYINYFANENTAQRYALGRPFFHLNTINKVKAFLQIQNNLENALDVACGTGLSTQALLDVADNIWATDTSTEMLAFAPKNDRIKYAVSPAETLNADANFFDLITVCSGIHWFDIDKFLCEANRVLKNQAHLVLYENYFISEMIGNAEFDTWFEQIYLQKFPSPSRNDTFLWTNENLLSYHFTLLKEEHFKNTIEFSQAALVLYFTTQSNITTAVESGKYTYLDIEKWLNSELYPFFKAEKRNINYGNWVKYLQKTNE